MPHGVPESSHSQLHMDSLTQIENCSAPLGRFVICYFRTSVFCWLCLRSSVATIRLGSFLLDTWPSDVVYSYRFFRILKYRNCISVSQSPWCLDDFRDAKVSLLYTLTRGPLYNFVCLMTQLKIEFFNIIKIKF